MNILDRMIKAAPLPIIKTQHYSGNHDLVMMWGVGRLEHNMAWDKQIAAGKHCIGFDLGYFDRPEWKDTETHYRLYIDSKHPTAEQLSRESSPRAGRTFTLRNDYDPNGKVMIIGLGKKPSDVSNRTKTWEQVTYEKLLKEFPKEDIVLRPKYARTIKPVNAEGIPVSPDVPIEEGLKGVRLVVCRHSNVAVDACIAGIPVRCEAGAAYSLYKDNENPTPEQRLQFLNRLSWFDWLPHEAKDIWAFALKQIYG